MAANAGSLAKPGAQLRWKRGPGSPQRLHAFRRLIACQAALGDGKYTIRTHCLPRNPVHHLGPEVQIAEKLNYEGRLWIQ